MTDRKLTEQQKEQISAFVDGEQPLNDVTMDEALASSLERYSLIGDVMRGDSADFVALNIADRVAAALENEAPHQGAEESIKQQNNVVQMSAWRKPFAQFAIAASVAACAIVGVQFMPSQHDVVVAEQVTPASQLNQPEVPIWGDDPVGGFAAPVSLSNEPALKDANATINEAMERRFGALIYEHSQQVRRANAVREQEITEEEQK